MIITYLQTFLFGTINIKNEIIAAVFCPGVYAMSVPKVTFLQCNKTMYVTYSIGSRSFLISMLLAQLPFTRQWDFCDFPSHTKSSIPPLLVLSFFFTEFLLPNQNTVVNF